MKSVVLDTSALMNCNNLIEALSKDYHVVIPIVVIEELDNLKTNRDTERAMQARNAIRQITTSMKIISFDMNRVIAGELYSGGEQQFNSYNANDDIIVTSAYINQAALCTHDLNLTIKANILGIETVSTPKSPLYRGYKKVIVTDEELAYFYSHVDMNVYDCLINQYLLLYNDSGECIDKLKWDGTKYVQTLNKNIKTKAFGTLKPKDEFQVCALDSIENNDITMLYGRAGSGKTFLTLSYLMKLLEAGKISKIYVVYSYDTLRGAKTLGYEKGNHEDKLLMSGSLGNILSTKFGGIDAVRALLIANELEIIPTANIRGVEFNSDSAVFVTEVQNLDIYTLKTIIQRCNAGCKQIYEGDIIEQTDTNVIHSGAERMINVFKDNSCFGCVKLKHNYRNPITSLADSM